MRTIKFHKNINSYDLHQFPNIWQRLFQSTSQFRCFRKLRRFKSYEFKIKKLKWARKFLKTIKFHKNINPYDLHQFQNIWRKFNSINFLQSLVRFEEKLFSRFHIVEKNNVRSDESRGAVGWASANHGRCLPMVTGSIPGPVGTFLHNFFAFLENLDKTGRTLFKTFFELG